MKKNGDIVAIANILFQRIVSTDDFRHRVFNKNYVGRPESKTLVNLPSVLDALKEHSVLTMNLKDKDVARFGIMATFLMFVVKHLPQGSGNTFLVDYEFSVSHTNKPGPDPSADAAVVAVVQINNVRYTYAFTISCNKTCMCTCVTLCRHMNSAATHFIL